MAKERVGCVILAAEGSGGIQRRIAAAKTNLGIESELPIAWATLNGNLLSPDIEKQVIESLKESVPQFHDLHGVRLGAIFIDAISAACGIEDENDAGKANAAMRVIRRIATQPVP